MAGFGAGLGFGLQDLANSVQQQQFNQLRMQAMRAQLAQQLREQRQQQMLQQLLGRSSPAQAFPMPTGSQQAGVQDTMGQAAPQPQTGSFPSPMMWNQQPPRRAMMWDQFRPMMQAAESGGRNIPNYRFDPTHTASGVNQITDSTWNRYAPQVGAPQLHYPASPMDRPEAEQNRVGQAIYNKEGPGPWANYNPRLAAQSGQGQRQGAAPQQSEQLAAKASGMIDPAMYGQAQMAQLAQAIEQADPSADGFTKWQAFEYLSKMLHPQEQMQYQLLKQQNQQLFELQKLQLQGSQRSDLQTQRDVTAEQRQGEHEAASEQRTQEVIAGQAARQKTGIAAKQEAQPVGNVDQVADMIAHYQMAPLSGWTMRGPWGQAVMGKVKEINPDYQATEFAARQSGARAFASGRQADTVRSMSVAIDHLGVAEDLGVALKNNDVRMMNTLKNRMATEFGYEGPVDFNTAKMIVTDEVTKAVAGGMLSMTERVALGDQLGVASSPEQLTGVITTLKRLLAGQLGGLRRQYEAATGKAAADFDALLSPQAKQQLSIPAAGQKGTEAGQQPTLQYNPATGKLEPIGNAKSPNP